jgi:hypothetical protein
MKMLDVRNPIKRPAKPPASPDATARTIELRLSGLFVTRMYKKTAPVITPIIAQLDFKRGSI